MILFLLFMAKKNYQSLYPNDQILTSIFYYCESYLFLNSEHQNVYM